LNTEWTRAGGDRRCSSDGSGLGFGIVGSKSTGVVVRTILSGGAADRDGRLLLRRSHPQRRHGVHPRHGQRARRQPPAPVQRPGAPYCCPRRPGRGVAHSPTAEPGRLCQLTPTAELDAHLADLLATMQPQLNDEEAMAEAEQQDSRFHKPPQLPNSRNSAEENPEEDFENEEEKTFHRVVEPPRLQGARHHHCGISKLSGIFIKSILPGSEAGIQGRLAVNDRIVRVNGSSLEGCSNHAAVELLRSCGSRVRLRLVRYKSGHVHHQLMAHTLSTAATADACGGKLLALIWTRAAAPNCHNF
uniref:PDZ domain-containing protein n=1 Tax=Macrostomum lignano TaxID=282301 RepID=A0A1I8FDT3_9PLAT